MRLVQNNINIASCCWWWVWPSPVQAGVARVVRGEPAKYYLVILGITQYKRTNLRSSLRSLSEVSRFLLSLRLASTPPGSENPLMLALVIMIVLGTRTMLQPSYEQLDNLIPCLSTVYVTVCRYIVLCWLNTPGGVLLVIDLLRICW